jgi:hypothetical protein
MSQTEAVDNVDMWISLETPYSSKFTVQKKRMECKYVYGGIFKLKSYENAGNKE